MKIIKGILALIAGILVILFGVCSLLVDDSSGGKDEGSVFVWIYLAVLLFVGIFLIIAGICILRRSEVNKH
jgi:hypothetical protein